MALDDVNMDVELLPNYALRLHYHNSKVSFHGGPWTAMAHFLPFFAIFVVYTPTTFVQCKPGLAARQLFELLYKAPTKLILLSGKQNVKLSAIMPMNCLLANITSDSPL